MLNLIDRRLVQETEELELAEKFFFSEGAKRFESWFCSLNCSRKSNKERTCLLIDHESFSCTHACASAASMEGAV